MDGYLLILSMVGSSPIAFLISYWWSYRWETYDNGGGIRLLWGLLRNDVHCSIPGRHGDRARIIIVRRSLQKYARMGKGVHIPGINEPLKKIIAEKRYSDYAHFFVHPKWWIWLKAFYCLVWPVTFLLWFMITIIKTYYVLTRESPE